MPCTLAPYAVTEHNSRGRQFPEKPHRYRADFERDRDRIIHCAAFRRLEGKTQVFTTGLNDQYRTRMTHSIEVAQIGRTIARVLNLNESLTEAICLAHDLGHSPFGHAGEAVLNQLTADVGGFEHNRQSLRIVDFLEHPYPAFAGLNLMLETRMALAKHHSPYDKPEGSTECICLEGRIADVADRIAYNCHDLEDGLRSRLLNEGQLKGVALYDEACRTVGADRIDDIVIRRTRISKAILDYLAIDAIETSRQLLETHHIGSLEDVYACPVRLIDLSAEAETKLRELEQFLYKNLYYHPQIAGQGESIRGWLTRLFEKYSAGPELMPHYYQHMIAAQGLKRIVCDYVSGMTDRYAMSMQE
ncbi:MAG: deoxyguanosinetriphosphate triphosphohydrolase [Anaerohalosphaeraceae bacterium]